MRITEAELFEYIFCPARYEMKYVKKIDLPEYNSMDKMLNKVAKFFFVNLLNGKVCSVNELKNKWDSICKANPDFIDAKKSIAGLGLIVNLADWASKERLSVIDIDTKFNLVIDGVVIEGYMGGPILSRPNGGLELLITSFSSRIPDQVDIDMKLKYSLDALAFAEVLNKDLDGIRVHSVKSYKDLKTIRSKEDFNRIKRTVKSVAKGIENEIYYPRENVLCSTCNANAYCKMWH
jgi:ASC-1-like (ASCH) protein